MKQMLNTGRNHSTPQTPSETDGWVSIKRHEEYSSLLVRVDPFLNALLKINLIVRRFIYLYQRVKIYITPMMQTRTSPTQLDLI